MINDKTKKLATLNDIIRNDVALSRAAYKTSIIHNNGHITVRLRNLDDVPRLVEIAGSSVVHTEGLNVVIDINALQ